MTDQKLTSAIKKVPFEPVQLILSNGTTYNVTHPDSNIIRKRMIAVAVGNVIHTISNIHINQVVSMPTVQP